MKSITYNGVTYLNCKMNRPAPPPIFDGAHGYAGWERGEYEIDVASHKAYVKKFEEYLTTLEVKKKQSSWVDAIPRNTDKCEAKIISASTLNEDGTETEYYNRERDGHKELSELLPDPDDISILDNPFEGYSKDDIIYSQHAIILNLKKEVADLKLQMTGHLKSVHY